MSTTLSKEQIDAYWRDGYLFPLPALPTEKANDFRNQLESIETDRQNQLLNRPLKDYIRTHSDVIIPMANDGTRCC
jgi:hypothetical protein